MNWRWKTQRFVDVESVWFAFFGFLRLFNSLDEILMRAKREKHGFEFAIEEIFRVVETSNVKKIYWNFKDWQLATE